ncbi:HTH-type transcriptional repressor FabR [Alishewanella sp. SMS8]|uniref:HTH-type transcriptional repressor FabR n=1 Tax=unclassified Alishewanella TaxID=2628974 RepID=UPI0027423B1B|nr:HTH-type transcriptional repressor FabR [Alishewanella sp. SMS8]MDP4945533.1 HTH-type transcriptional repressor FabR [Alishewanella sp.]MDP5206122.1 HTH-type transcriptional repressor FabR [Alishewanella sp. SMS9]MDP5035860.1 HTH-type transcriptional repressor FabR [Alishewanella sp.]MDP5186972.1 HTH-type transcriptional repressor FabR [Alishewanella sp.]MDP5460499.1 HTH-type transcriptional repressor FabR [Alishewanella sp. SMS8]
MSRAEQKERTRQAIINAAFSQLSAEKSFASLSLREVAREAGIAPTSFYRHFSDMDELGLTLVDEAGLMLRQLMRQARLRIENNGSVISTSVETFMEFVTENSNVFRLLLRERSGTSAAFRAAVAREIQHFSAELAHYLRKQTECTVEQAQLQADAMVTLVFHTGADALDAPTEQCRQLTRRTILQLRWLAHGAASYGRKLTD